MPAVRGLGERSDPRIVPVGGAPAEAELVRWLEELLALAAAPGPRVPRADPVLRAVLCPSGPRRRGRR